MSPNQYYDQESHALRRAYKRKHEELWAARPLSRAGGTQRLTKSFGRGREYLAWVDDIMEDWRQIAEAELWARYQAKLQDRDRAAHARLVERSERQAFIPWTRDQLMRRERARASIAKARGMRRTFKQADRAAAITEIEDYLARHPSPSTYA
jgi:hypothetical protein